MNIIIANDKGGVGKTLLAQYVISLLRRAGETPRIAEFDRQPKLGRLYGSDAVYSRDLLGRDCVADGERDDAAWDPLVKWLQVRRPLVLDLGAQAWSMFAEWAARSDLPTLYRGRGTVVLVPVTADLEALKGAELVLTRLPSVLPDARAALLPCDKDGAMITFEELPDWVEIRRMAHQRNVDVVAYPVLRSEGWPLLAARGFTLEMAATATAAAVATKGLPPAAAARTLKGIKEWDALMRQLFARVLTTEAA